MLDLSSNALTGPIPPELGDLASLGSLYLFNNALTGAIPPELGNLSALGSLEISFNEGLSGALPMALTALQRLYYLYAQNTGLCAPTAPEFQQWLDGLEDYQVPGFCGGG